MELAPEFASIKLTDLFRIFILTENIETRKKSEHVYKHFANSSYFSQLLKYTAEREFKLNWKLNGIVDLNVFGSREQYEIMHYEKLKDFEAELFVYQEIDLGKDVNIEAPIALLKTTDIKILDVLSQGDMNIHIFKQQIH
jgi:hypothetical protein